MQKFAIAGLIALGLLWLGLEAAREHPDAGPGNEFYLNANDQFGRGDYPRAAELYAKALAQKADHLPALRGHANALLKSGRPAHALTSISRAVALEPEFAGNYAIRGIVHDHLGNYQNAISDYRAALTRDPSIADGMGWFDRFLYNVQERPPSIADRLGYLEQQLQLPPEQRVLRRPEIDAAQRPYER